MQNSDVYRQYIKGVNPKFFIGCIMDDNQPGPTKTSTESPYNTATKKMHVNLSNLEESKGYLREVIVKIGLEKINTQEGVIVEMLSGSSAIGLVMSSEFARKQGFKLKKIERSIYKKCGLYTQQARAYIKIQ